MTKPLESAIGAVALVTKLLALVARIYTLVIEPPILVVETVSPVTRMLASIVRIAALVIRPLVPIVGIMSLVIV